jgi:hypothetical protein
VRTRKGYVFDVGDTSLQLGPRGVHWRQDSSAPLQAIFREATSAHRHWQMHGMSKVDYVLFIINLFLEALIQTH